MRKEEQKIENKLVLDAIADFNKQAIGNSKSQRLRNCSAVVFERGHYIVLQSYNTIVAIIDKDTDTLYDFLRYVYGYTSTSAQHIAKFKHDYGKAKWGCYKEYRYNNI